MLNEQSLAFFTTPILATCIVAEIVVSHLHRHDFYNTKDTLTNLYLTVMYSVFDLATRVASLSILMFFYQFHTDFFYNSGFFYWFLLFIIQDLTYWTMHFIDHRCRFFWAFHVVHHSSEHFNLSVGLRAAVLQPLYKFIYFIPLALVGFRCEDIYLIYAISQAYGILVHTQYFKKIPIFELIFITPSHHRVHHASNEKYIDKNMGMVTVFWDKLFGTFQKEDFHEPIRYGLKEKANLSFPTNTFLHEWKHIIADVKSTNIWSQKLMFIFGAPGWSPEVEEQNCCEENTPISVT